MNRDFTRVPKHVAVIMDGNGRWATERSMPRAFGHQKGAEKVAEIVEAAAKTGVEVLTLYAFSDENWGRPDEEVEALFTLLITYLKSEVDKLDKEDVRLTAIGDRHRLPKECLQLLEKGERQTKGNQGLRLILALSYGGRSDLVNSCRKIARQVLSGHLSWQDIDQDLLGAHLSTGDVPNPDLLIRTSGEKRISNFLLWELAYAELYFHDGYWPDFTKDDFLDALRAFELRDRRFGKVAENAMISEVDSDLGGLRC